MRIVWLIALVGGLFGASLAAHAQDSALAASDLEVTVRVGSFGQPVTILTGQLTNTGAEAYADIQITANAYDAGDSLIGEGFGVLGDSCGASLPLEYALQPGMSQGFALAIEVLELDAAIERLEVTASGTPIAPAPPPPPLPDAIRVISSDEVVSVEWTGARTLRYGAGCVNDLFTAWTWSAYNDLTETSRPEAHPRAEAVTDALRVALRLEDEALFLRSRLSFDPDGTRLVFQDGINYVYTAAADGRVQRLLYTGLNSYTLQDIYWLADDRFIAHYYGAFGDDVSYFTADAEARPISPAPLRNRPSVIRPGATADGRRIILGGTFNDASGTPITGYFINVVTNGFFEPLFEADLPGNNYPSPIPLTDADDLVSQIYIANAVDGLPVMQCFNRAEGVLYDLTPLPFRLTDGHRAQWWISPDQRSIALAADGGGGGLWWIDLAALPACAAG